MASANDDNLDDDSWDIRETFAYFGRAFYTSSVFEVGLVHALLFGSFLKEVRNDFVADDGKSFDRARYEAEFDKFMSEHFAQTLGNILNRVKQLPHPEPGLIDRLVTAKKRRDFLVHHYWRERSVEFATANGRAQMRVELEHDTEMFLSLDREVDRAMKPSRENLGISDEMLESNFRKFRERIEAGLPPDDIGA